MPPLLGDPSNEAIPAFNPPRPIPWAPAETNASGDQVSNDTAVFNSIPQPEIGQLDEKAPQSGPSTPLIIILVALLVVSTAILIRVFWKPNNKAR